MNLFSATAWVQPPFVAAGLETRRLRYWPRDVVDDLLLGRGGDAAALEVVAGQDADVFGQARGVERGILGAVAADDRDRHRRAARRRQ